MPKIRINYDTDAKADAMQKQIMEQMHMKKPQFSEKVIDFYLERMEAGEIDPAKYRKAVSNRGGSEVKDYTYLTKEYLQQADECAKELGIKRGQFLYYATFEYCQHMLGKERQTVSGHGSVRKENVCLGGGELTEKQKSVLVTGIMNALVTAKVAVNPEKYTNIWNALNGTSELEAELRKIFEDSNLK